MGGMFGESKFDVQKKIPEKYLPKTILIPNRSTPQFVIKQIHDNGYQFPVIFKPDLGERGWRVQRINTEDEIRHYVSDIQIDFIIQELVELPLEFGVFYVRYPSELEGKVVSVVGKEMLSIQGDGEKTLQQLILEKDRAKLQWKTLRATYRERLSEVLPRGSTLELVAIGNHCLGTKFLNCNHLITQKLSSSFDTISQQIEGFYFGRYDLRVASLEDLENGNVKIVELNGCGAEPAHIYEPGFSIWKALSVLYQHWNDIYRISKENHLRGIPYISFWKGRAIFRKFKRLTTVS